MLKILSDVQRCNRFLRTFLSDDFHLVKLAINVKTGAMLLIKRINKYIKHNIFNLKTNLISIIITSDNKLILVTLLCLDKVSVTGCSKLGKYKTLGVHYWRVSVTGVS